MLLNRKKRETKRKLSFLKEIVFFLLIFSIAYFLRFDNLNWDSNFHLHPDERFLTMVGRAMKFPTTISGYFNQNKSLLNPENIGFPFYVYGTFPVIFNKIIAIKLDNNSYNLFTLQGRYLSAFFDFFTIVLIFKFVWTLEKRFRLDQYLKYWSSFFYAISVYPIQASHFFTVDSFSVFFSFLSFFYAIKYLFHEKRKWACCTRELTYLFLSGFSFGLAISSKISSLYIFPLIFVLILLKKKEKYFLITSKNLFLFFTSTYFSVRFFDPYIFAYPNFFNWRLSNNFISSIKQLIVFTKTKDGWYPPMVQWISKTPIFLLKNFIFFTFGIIPSFFLLIGGIIILFKFIKSLKENWKEKSLFTLHKEYVFFFIVSWFILFSIYQSLQLTRSIRYTYILFPFASIISAFGLIKLLSKFKARFLASIFVVFLSLIWPIAFISIYEHPHSRVIASQWIYKNLPPRSIILGEYWDDPLPLAVEKTYGKTFEIKLLPVFNQDNQKKWQKMDKLLKKGDYYILSSNRGWGSILAVPKKYPQMSKFYQNLLSGKNPYGYKKVKEFTSYPKLDFFGKKIIFRDSWAEETFSVYDHPQVMIFKRTEKIRKVKEK